MEIRPARSTDLVDVRDCARAAYEPYVARMGREPAPMTADFAASITAGTLHVLEADGQIAGFIVFYRRDDHVHIENVAVSPGKQGKGCGRRLIDFAEGQARDLGVNRIELYTNEKMVENFRYYESIGYRETGRRAEDGFNRVYYEKVL